MVVCSPCRAGSVSKPDSSQDGVSFKGILSPPQRPKEVYAHPSNTDDILSKDESPQMEALPWAGQRAFPDSWMEARKGGVSFL